MVKNDESGTGARTRRVLMLCYYFPPLSSAGTQRSVGFARWLHECGWTPVVLTVQRSRTRWEHGGEKIPQEIAIVRTIELNLDEIFSAYVAGKTTGEASAGQPQRELAPQS